MGVQHGLSIETELDPARQPFLHDHQIDGTPVLPGVMGIEGFAEAAQRLFPSLRVRAVEDVRFLAPFKFYRNEPRSVSLLAHFDLDGDEVVARCRLVGSRTLALESEVRTTTHFEATVRLASALGGAQRAPAPGAGAGQTVGHDDIYRVYFHGPAYQVLDSAWRQNEAVVGRLRAPLPEHHAPPELPTALEPRWLELCFQTAGVWQIGRTGRMGLPERIARLSLFDAPRPARDLHAVVTPHSDGTGFDAVVVDGDGAVHLELTGYGTAELPATVPGEIRAPLARAME
jgi:acyl transferase domain-containing protein